jgi:hypothetical protein
VTATTLGTVAAALGTVGTIATATGVIATVGTVAAVIGTAVAGTIQEVRYGIGHYT